MQRGTVSHKDESLLSWAHSRVAHFLASLCLMSMSSLNHHLSPVSWFNETQFTDETLEAQRLKGRTSSQ